MLDLRIWDKKTPLTYPDGTKRTAEEVFQDYPLAETEVTVLEYLTPTIVGGIDTVKLLDLYLETGRITPKEYDSLMADSK